MKTDASQKWGIYCQDERLLVSQGPLAFKELAVSLSKCYQYRAIYLESAHSSFIKETDYSTLGLHTYRLQINEASNNLIVTLLFCVVTVCEVIRR
jgi:hypothetical protein